MELNVLGMRSAWSLQNELNASEFSIPTQEEMMAVIWSIPRVDTRLLVLITYLTAGRISEVLALFKANFGDRRAIKDRKEYDIFLISMKNEKNRKTKVKRIPIDYAKFPKEIELIKGYLKRLEPFQKLFRFTRQHAYTLIKESTGYNPHWIRHIRLTHRCLEDGLNEQLLQKMAGWTDTRPAATYVKTRWVDII